MNNVVPFSPFRIAWELRKTFAGLYQVEILIKEFNKAIYKYTRDFETFQEADEFIVKYRLRNKVRNYGH